MAPVNTDRQDRRHKGKITGWKDDRGFGFITPDTGGESVFLHIRSFVSQGRRPVVGEEVTYEFGRGTDGRPRAEQVEFSEDGLLNRVARKRGWIAVLFALLVLVTICAAAFYGSLPVFVAILYFASSIAAFTAYGLDKSAAKHGRQRHPENTLHLFALVGGWPGALIAQKVFRHKSRKLSFQIIYWLTVILNSSVLIWFFVPPGARLMRTAWVAVTQIIARGL